ncbi:glycosyltransferase family 4 protein [Chelatococcus daeguensis]|uniref:Glycosyl transferase n=2 Tax=Chelatococcus TaxID=28209 RepID=A0AAC9P0C3_9HYPH|nr:MULTISPECIES: glycosyltransferase family 4 protein [Chelatococcus]APF39469.1 glycosyl transferase [Chelatococcus daeguensis]KZE29176.1 glycosyl transferase [Chelatococcus daeguensis]MBM3083889.1 glycosyltransferase family 4 protein [Chelatococcus daeguensis]CUA86960.1 Glycosyltransferase involved in cell wall bisynthesis [Chelatococcus sambhunathii]
MTDRSRADRQTPRAANHPLRVLVVSHGHPSFSLGGAEIASYNLHKGLNRIDGVGSRYLARVGHPVARHGATALLSLRQKQGEILYHADEYDHFLLSNRNTEEIERDFLRVVRDLRPDVVHFHHFIGLGLECLYAVRQALPETLIIVTFHEFLSICHHHGQMVKTGGAKLCNRASPADCNACFPDISPARFLRREHFVRGLLDVADHFVSPSRFLVERYVDWGLDASRFTVIENGLDIAEPAPPRPLPAGGRRCRFAYFGQITSFKGVDVLLDAVGRIPEAVWGEDAQLMIFGGNLERQPKPFQEKIEALIERAGPRVRFYGAYQNSEMPRLMRSIDWTIIPSIWWENSPIVIQESFFHGRPLISSNIGGMAEKITDGVDGLHFRVGSSEDLVDRMVEALTDETLWERLRARITRPIDYEECARRHLDLYNAVAAERAATRATAAVPSAAARSA